MLEMSKKKSLLGGGGGFKNEKRKIIQNNLGLSYFKSSDKNIAVTMNWIGGLARKSQRNHVWIWRHAQCIFDTKLLHMVFKIV